MNKILLIFLLGLLVSCDGVFKKENSEEGHNHSTIKSYYTCSMHPQIKQDKPGKCPICHMNLTKVEVDEADDVPATTQVEKPKWACKDFPDVTSEVEDVCPMDGSPMVKVKSNKAGKVIGKVKLRKSQLSHFKPDFFPVTGMMMKKKIRLLGSVLQSEDKESNIPARIGGRIEKVYVKSTGSFISLGEPVIDLYSPQLITAGEEYLIARKSFEKDGTAEFKDMLKQSEERLKLWGIKRFQFERWFKRGRIPRKIVIYSPATGIVQKRNAVVGKYFKEGQNFFELSDLSDIWVEMDVYEQDASLVKIGQRVKMEFTSLPGEVLEGEIDFINPVLNSKSRTLKVRTTVANTSGKLKPGMVSEATLEIQLPGTPLVVPRTAIIDTGKRKVVWTKVSGKQFQAKTIHSGYESEGYVEIKHGLMEGEEVVIEGNFLLDAQAQLFGGYEDMENSGSSGHNH
ncbi:MAG: efflux transporter periplasmic adaptor subunit [Halobacteriovorax sp.]|nr:efflux transporter periplasmic adaptor subunit [Halobacteriovorax sp.]|tara:strand:+ start:136932 stop:138296 length:1365 start_codon:yes stop_codon:yes gene_type:complete